LTFITVVIKPKNAITPEVLVAKSITPEAENPLAFEIGFPEVRVIAGLALGQASITGLISFTQSIAGLAQGQSIAVGTMSGDAVLAGQADGISITTGAAQALRFMAGIAAGNSVTTGTAQGETGISTEVQAVFDRMSALTQTEKDAIQVMVDNLVADGIWANVTGLWCPALNGTDFLTDFINDASPLTLPSGGTHTPGEYIDFAAGGHAQTPNISSNYGFGLTSFPICMGLYVVLTAADTINNTQYLGYTDATNSLQYGFWWRGTDTNDYNVNFGKTGNSPRPPFGTRASGDFLAGGGNTTTEDFFLFEGGADATLSRTNEATFDAQVIHFNGRNQQGSSNSARASRHSLWFIGAINNSEAVVLRTRVLQFLIDLGVTGVPTP